MGGGIEGRVWVFGVKEVSLYIYRKRKGQGPPGGGGGGGGGGRRWTAAGAASTTNQFGSFLFLHIAMGKYYHKTVWFVLFPLSTSTRTTCIAGLLLP